MGRWLVVYEDSVRLLRSFTPPTPQPKDCWGHVRCPPESTDRTRKHLQGRSTGSCPFLAGHHSALLLPDFSGVAFLPGTGGLTLEFFVAHEDRWYQLPSSLAVLCLQWGRHRLQISGLFKVTNGSFWMHPSQQPPSFWILAECIISDWRQREKRMAEDEVVR